MVMVQEWNLTWPLLSPGASLVYKNLVFLGRFEKLRLGFELFMFYNV